MKNYEKESLFKNFLVFFSLLEILLILLFVEVYRTQQTHYKHTLLQEMRVCSYSLTCEKFSFDFSPQEDNLLNVLYDEAQTYAYFSIPKSKKFYMKIVYKNLDKDINAIYFSLWWKFALASLILFIVALFFTFYSLHPIRQALKLNDEFIKDILHDFNTPIASMVLNIKMLQDEKGEDATLRRISKGIEGILRLQNNLKSFLHHSIAQNESVDIALLAEECFNSQKNIYPRLTFIFEKEDVILKQTNPELLRRILDNLLSNASKYNKQKGTVTLYISKNKLHIIDTGKGMKDVKKVFQRYYKEQERGIGLGLHIVKKLCNELNIIISIESKIQKGTKVTLDFKHLAQG